MIDKKLEQFSEIEVRLSSKLTQLEKVMDVTHKMHSSMQDSMKLWLDQREKDMQVKRPKITEDVILAQNSKFTIPLVKTKVPNDNQFSNNNITKVNDSKINSNNSKVF